MGIGALSSPAPGARASSSSTSSPPPCPAAPGTKEHSQPQRSQGPWDTLHLSQTAVSSSQLNVTNPSTEEATLQGQAKSVGKNTECAGTSHPIHHCPCLPVVPSPHCLAENWPQTRAPSPGVLEPSAEGGPASISKAPFPGFAFLESTLLPKQAPTLIFYSLLISAAISLDPYKAIGCRKVAGNDR